jgi:hypothetical protein
MLKFIIGGFSAWCSICGSCAKWRARKSRLRRNLCWSIKVMYAPNVSLG